MRYLSHIRTICQILLVGVFFVGCKQTKDINDGTLAFELKKYHTAQQLLPKEIASARDPLQKYNKSVLLAKSYEYSNQPTQATKWYKEALDIRIEPEVLFDYALQLKATEQYEEAILVLQEYIQLTADRYRANPEISICQEAVNNKTYPTNIRIVNLEQVNSPQADYSPFLWKDQLLFTSDRISSVGGNIHPWTGRSNGDIYSAQRTGDTYSSVQSFDNQINSEEYEGVLSVETDHSALYFSRCAYDDKEDGFCKIYTAQWNGAFWDEIEKIDIFSDTVNVSQPFISPDGSRLFFVSDASFGYGGKDIYFIEKSDIGWSSPYNAGPRINTVGDDMFPFVDKEGNLYFSSDGRTGFGGLDIYKAEKMKNGWEKVRQLPHPINSGADDFGFYLEKPFTSVPKDNILESGFFSSSRSGGKGSDDLYQYQKEYINFYTLQLDVVEKNYADSTNPDSEVKGVIPLPGAVILLTSLTKTSDEQVDTTTPSSSWFDLEAETDYKILVSKSGYFNRSTTVSTKGMRSVEEVIISLHEVVELERIFPEKEIVIPNIYYDYDKATLRPESLPVLDTLVSFFQENADLIIEIGSHTDSRGSDSYNERLSQDRAQSVVDYLILKGVPKEQLKAKGYGEYKLVNQCKNGVSCSEELHQENRRTTFRVITQDAIIESIPK